MSLSSSPTAQAQDSVLTFERVGFGYPGRAIISDISFEVRRGELLALMGGSGVGKTTLLRLIAGLLSPGIGSIRAFGEPVDARRQDRLYAQRKRMGLLFQFGALFTDLSCLDNVAFPLREHSGLPEDLIRDIALLKLEAVGLRGAADLMPSQISGGMARRVALARAIALDPELILYDEPFAGLDPISLGVTARLIQRLNRALGASAIIVTHDIQETFAIADRVIVLAPTPVGAEIRASGTPKDLMASEDPYVQQFLHGHEHGPVSFHHPAAPLADLFGGA